MKTKRLSKGLVVSILAASASSLVPAATFTSIATGDWSVPASWDTNAGFPNTYTTDSAIIDATHTISYDGSIPTLGGNLAVANGNSLTINGGSLTQTWVPGVPPPFGTTIAIGVSNGAGTGVGALNINAGGSFTSGTANTVVVGVSLAALGGGAANGTVNVNQGTMTLSAAASSSLGGQGLAVGVNAAGTGTINVGNADGAADSSLVDLATNNVTFTVGGTNGEGAGTGTVNIKSDGRVNTGTARAYVGDGGTGTLTVDGGTLAVGVGGLTVGRAGGNGTLSVTSGLATIDGPGGSESFMVGDGTGSTGTVAVSGGTLNSVNNMLIGVNGGTGVVNQTGGAVSFGGWGAIGYGAGGAGSQYNISGGTLTGNGGAPLEIGTDREGAMTISGTATVNVDKIALGIRNNGNGTLNITGGTTTTKLLAVAGDQGGLTHTGVVNITGGTNTIVGGGGQSYLGRQAGSTGTLNLTGGSLANSSGQDFQIGFEGGTGNLNVSAGGTMSHNWWFNLARGAGSTGNVTISGAGSAIAITGADARTNVGEDGTGTLAISNGGSFTTQSEVAVGRNGASNGTLSISDAGSSLNLTGGDRHLYVGGREGTGTGTMTMTGGAVNLNGNRVQIADSPGSTGTVNVTGGQITGSQWFHVGNGAGATGTLNVNYTNPADSITTGALYVGNGGSTGNVNILSGDLIANGTVEVGRYGGGIGTLTVSGAGNEVRAFQGGAVDDFVRIGRENGNGTLNVQAGAAFHANQGWLTLGQNDGSVGVANVTGAGSTLTSKGIIVGWSGQSSGTLNIADGAVVNSTGHEISVGRDWNGSLAASPVGTINVSSGGTLTGPNLRIGHNTTGILNINGGTVNGSGWAITGDGGTSDGTINLSAGTLNNSDWMVVGNNPGSVGKMDISGGTFNVNAGGDSGRFIIGRLGNATVNQSGGAVNVGNWFAMGIDPGSNATYNFSGGTLDVRSNIDIANNSSTAVMNITHGNAAGTTITGNGGGVAPGINVGSDAGATGANGTLNINLQDAGHKITATNLYAGNNRGNANNVSTVGTINIVKGILENHNETQIGRNNGVGILNVLGAEAKWERGTLNGQRSDMQIGFNGGTGTVNVQNGGTVNTNWWVNLGRGGGSNGTLVVDGPGSTFNVVSSGDNNAHTNVGEDGTGTLQIQNGGVYNHMMAIGVGGANVGGGEFYIGRNTGSNGTVIVSGAGSTLNSKSQEFRVGANGPGTLNINDGAVVNYTSTNQGGANVDGNFGVGHGNTHGQINMNNGTLNVSAWALFGAWDHATSSATINMVNSTINVLNHTGGAGHLFWGDVGTAIINQEGGAINAQGWSAIGRERGGNATYNLGMGGGGGSMSVGGSGGNELYVGRQSNGTINMGNGTTLNVVGLLAMGRDTATSNGTITNNGGAITVGGFEPGRNSIGNYTQNAGQLQVNGSANVGHEANGNGTMSILGGIANITGNLDVANGGGDATLLINNGATVNTQAFYVGTNAGSIGTVNVAHGTLNLAGWSEIGRHGGQATVNISGPSAVFDGSNDDLMIGHATGSGTVNVTAGGQFVHNWWINLGRDGGNGTMLVDGAGSKVTQTRRGDGNNDARFNIGGDPNGSQNNTGALTVSNGGLVERTSDGGEVNVGRQPGSTGTLTIISGGRFTNVGANTFVGQNAGNGTVNIASGGQYTSGFGENNIGDGGTGTVNISGAGSKFLASTRGDDNFHRVGRGGTGNGSLNIQDGGEWHNNGWFTIAESGSTGNVLVDGAGSKLTTTNGLIVGWSGTGQGTLTVSNNAVVRSTAREVSIGRDFSGSLATSPTGVVNLASGGTLIGNELRIGHGATGTVNINGGKLFSPGGWAIIADGASSLGTLNMTDGEINISDRMFVGMQGAANGTFNQSGGTTKIAGEFMLGRSGATGSLNLSGGTFDVGGWTVVGGGRDGGAGTGTINVTNGAKYTHLQTGGDLLNGWQAGSTGTINIGSGGSMIQNWWVRLGVDAGSTGNLTVDGAGSIFEQGTVGGDTRFFVGEGGTGNLNVSNGGKVKVRNGLAFGGSFDEAGKLGTGTLNLNGGHVEVGGEINFGIRGGGSTGNANVSGGTMSNNSWFIVGRGGAGNYTQSGGRVWQTAQELRIGNDAGGVGTMAVTGGTFNSFSHGMVGESGTGTLNLAGGIVGIGCCTGGNLFIGHLNGSSGTVNVGGGVLDVGGSVEFNTQGGALAAILNLNGGILAADFINNPTGNGVAVLNANGGTIRATQNEANFIRGMSPAQLVLNGPLTIDTNNLTVTVNSVFSGTGGLVKNGFGQLNLTANQTSTGLTTTSAGVLNLDFTASAAPNDLVNNAGLVLNGGTLRVTSTAVANTQNFLGTEIAFGASRVEVAESGSGIGTIALGAITRSAAGGTADIGATGNITTTNANTNGILGLGLTSGNDWAKNDGTGKIVAAVAADYAATFGATNNLDVTVAGIVGGGAVHSIKTVGNVTLNANTTVGTGGILVPSTAGATDLLIASGAGETLTSGNLLDIQVIQNNVASNLIVASQVTGAIALTKSGPGALVLANPTNNYSGGTFINSGAVVIGADSALGDVNGGITLSSSSLGAGAALAVTDTMTLAATRAITLNGGGGGFSVPATKTLTIGQGISGPGGLGKVGAGTLVLGGNNTYTGETAIFEGGLEVNGTIGSTAALTVDGNLTLGIGANITAVGAVQIARNAGPTLTVTGVDATLSGGEFTVGGAGNANVTLTGASTLAASCDLFVARLAGSTSSLTVTGGAVIGQKNVTIGAAGGATGTATVTDGSFTASGALTVGNAGGTGTLNLAGTTGSYGYLEVGNSGTGTVNISGSTTLKGSTAGNSGYINIGANGGTGAINQTGGEVSHNSWIAIGLGGGSNDPASAQYNLSGGALTSSAGVEVGTDHGGSMNVSGTGNLAVSSISVGHRSNGNGVLNISGGTVTTNEITVAHNADNAGGTAAGVMNVSGGVTQVNGALIVARNGGGGSSAGTVNLGGGELKVNAITRGAGSSAQLNFNGTVIKPNASNGNFITGFDASSTDVQTGGAIFNTDGKNIGVSTALDGVGALTKAGAGQLQVSGDSSYAGGVNLDAGTLSVRHNNALGTGTVIGNGGILSFDNSTGPGLIEGRLNGSFNTTDAIPYDAIRLGTPKGHTTNPAEFGDNTTWGYRGTLVVPAGPDVTWSFAKQFDDSVRLLIDGNQLINDGTWNNAMVATTTLAAGEHTFEVRFGQGGGGVGPNGGWTLGLGIDTQGRNTLNPGDFVALTDPGDGSRLKYNDGGTADYTVANAMTLNVDTEIYVRQFGGGITGNIGGAGGINKTGNGKLTLAGTNNYAGATNIAAGTLQIGNGGSTGSLGAGDVTNAGSLKFDRTGTLNVPNIISGTGTLEQNGTGATILAGINTYTGATTVNAGDLKVNGSISGSTTTVNVNGTLSGTGTLGPVIINGGTLAPGNSSGILNVGNTTLNGGTFAIELNGTTAGTGYDQLNITGTLNWSANTALTIATGYTPTIGDEFTILSNDGTDTTLGIGLFTSAGNPVNDGDIFNYLGDGMSLAIDYTAGSDNNDIVLTVVPEPGSLVMLLGGLAILTGARRRRRA